MGLIHVTRGSSEIYIEDSFLAIHISSIGCVVGHKDAVAVLNQCGKRTSVSAVTSALSSGSRINGHAVKLATLAQVKSHFPGYRVVNHATRTGLNPACPTTVVWRIGKSRERVHYRSMTACRRACRLSVTDFDAIANKHPGWRALLPGCMDEIVVHGPGWKPPRGAKFNTGRVNPNLFRLRKLKSGRISLNYTGPASVSGINDVPHQALETGS